MKNFNQCYISFRQNIGGPVLYQWVETVKDYLSSKAVQNEDKCNVSDIQIEKPINDAPEELIIEIPQIAHGETILDRKSTFQGHLATVTSANQVRFVFKRGE